MKTKIIATVGPATSSFEAIEKLALSGMNVVRNNFAHCQYDEYKERYDWAQEINAKHGLNIKMQADLRGPIIRIGGVIPNDGIKVSEGDILKFVTVPCGDKKCDEIVIDDPYLHADVKEGDPMLIESGIIELIVHKTNHDSHKFEAKVLVGGTIYPRKAINFPRTKLTTSSITEKDIKDLNYVLSVGVDIVALSFISNADDVKIIRDIVGDNSKVKIWPKIERQAALDNIDEIIEASDGIIVARGDLGVETPYNELPIIQKTLVRKCLKENKEAIVATQMLKHMTESPYPTRAEISDIANAVFDGAHYVWLSDETANGKFPFKAIEVMKKVVDTVDDYLSD